MRSRLLEVPRCMNMGFHYTRQFSRRTRVKVLRLVDQAGDDWTRWYLKMHEMASLQRMADAGYTLIEIHFLYGFGLQGEREEVELTRQMTANAHTAGLKVLGYFQFFSVQGELFFLENPWARDCLQLQADGTPHSYRYDRPSLCFSHEKVRGYYLDGIELGLTYCDLDGIRLDNDYYKGCYCERCQAAFREYLKRTFSPEQTKRIFGIGTLEGVSLVPVEAPRDPLWAAMLRFRQWRRQEMMKLLSEKIRSIKRDAILGGNPALIRRPNDLARINVYPPDLGETHHLVCAENARFPARVGDSVRHQVIAYKHGQSNDFKVFPSHHLKNERGRTRWPETMQECALSLCEALCFGGHVACTTWGIRMDGSEDRTLYERPYFLDALTPVKDFLARHGHIYRGAACNARVGVYVNRESLAADYTECWRSLHGTVLILLTHQIPFRFVDRDEDGLLEGLDVLIVPDVKLVSDPQFERIEAFVQTRKALVTGQSFGYDAYYLPRERNALLKLLRAANVLHLENAPEKASESDLAQAEDSGARGIPVPERADAMIAALRKLAPPAPICVEGTRFIGVDTFSNEKGESFTHLLNYDNSRPSDVAVTISGAPGAVEILAPEGLGPEAEPVIDMTADTARVDVKALHTYMVVRYARA